MEAGSSKFSEHVITLNLEHYLGISVVVPDIADETAQRVLALLKLTQQPPFR